MVQLRQRLGRSPHLAPALRFVAALAGVAVVTQAIHFSSFPKPIGGVLGVAALLGFAWFGGFKPALLMAPLLLLLSRLAKDDASRWAPMASQEMVGLAFVTLVAATTGLAGEYRRRVRTVTRKHAQKLRHQARALSQAPIVFRTVDGRITEWNEGLQRLCGWTADEARGQLLHEFLDTRFPTSRAAIDQEMVRFGQWRGEVTMRHKNGNDLHVAMHWILYGDDGHQPIGVAEVWSDVTELRSAEAAVREADRRKDEFLAMLAHELRNPLAPIRTGIELLRLIQDDPDEVDATRNMMERQMTQLVTIVDDLLDVSRITRGKFELRKTKVALRDIISSAVEAVAPTMKHAQHKLTVNLPQSAIHLNADPHRLAQVISNLLDNAAKYTPQGGVVTLIATLQGNLASLVVADNGVGISAESLTSIFDMFNRSRHEGIAAFSGLGIGLALVKAIVEMHGGTVAAQSEGVGRGAQFLVHLPVLAEPSASVDAPLACDAAPPNDARRVLVVDDNIDAANALRLVIKKLGNEVQVAYDGRDAVAAAEQFLPEVIFLDLGMPHLDGYGAAQQIRERSWGKDMTLIALTGWGQDADKQRTSEAGFDHHLVKPADLKDLQRLLDSCRRRNGVAEPSPRPVGATVG